GRWLRPCSGRASAGCARIGAALGVGRARAASPPRCRRQTVQIVKAFRFRVSPDAAQIARLARWNDALRFLWNIALEQRLMGYARLRDKRVYPTAFDQMKELTELRAELPWLADVPRDVCAQLLVELDKAWQ